MTKDEFNWEWHIKVSNAYSLEEAMGKRWHVWVTERIPLLSPEAQDFIIAHEDTIGDWILEAVAGRVLERAIGLEEVRD